MMKEYSQINQPKSRSSIVFRRTAAAASALLVITSASASLGHSVKKLSTASAGTPLGSPARNTTYSCLGGSLVVPDRPWVDQSSGTLDLSKRPNVEGENSWVNREFTITLTDDKRQFKGNGLPSHVTGTYPVEKGTEAYQYYAQLPASGYDSAAEIPINSWNLDISVPRYPKVADTPTCVGKNSKITTGIATTGGTFHLEIAFDASNNAVDPNAALPLDSCWGHPYEGQYHYHGPSYTCFGTQSDTTTHSPLVGWALDGFGIYGILGENGQEMKNADLDECHGHTHSIEWEGQTVEMYHYHLNAEYPYSIGCFRGTPVELTSKDIAG